MNVTAEKIVPVIMVNNMFLDEDIKLDNLEEGIIIDGDTYYFVPTTDPMEAKEYNGYIDYDGNFYKVSKRLKHRPSHNRWAYYFKKLILSKTETFIDGIKNVIHAGDINYLMNGKGFIYYSHNTMPGHQGEPILSFPKKTNGKIEKLSSKQANMLFKIMQLNNELEFFPRTEEMEEINLRDSYYMKRMLEYNEEKNKSIDVK